MYRALKYRIACSQLLFWPPVFVDYCGWYQPLAIALTFLFPFVLIQRVVGTVWKHSIRASCAHEVEKIAGAQRVA